MKRVMLVSLIAVGCIKTDLVLVDRQTALERQASGSFKGLDQDLEQAGISPRPVPLTGAQLAASGAKTASAEQPETDVLSTSAHVDALLVRRCIGESLEGTLVETNDTCVGAFDAPEVSRVIERANRNRRQVWSYLQGRHQNAKLEDIRQVWRETRLRELVCGAQVQGADGKWEVKKC